ncbi:hypothetical protein [Nonomuraea cavernae]|uniref:Uncharacterized protein n=1 Tax=Nonomuraea cavernae TaxID=2045107 RepID=A0A917ZHN2_9ACTN|nr:hypothetical protein [Nonomuraea cavernae]MCA2186648.1 hypothetical protein [Nonomuraea cavernae]GGO83260.1 hypothetical protein GCM10012289_76330 [Nonomuraea cavernae]
MDPSDVARFEELLQVACEKGELDLSALREAQQLLSEMASAAVVLADHVESEISPLPRRHALRDDTGDEAAARLAEIHERSRRVAGLFAEAALHAHRSGAALGHIGAQEGNLTPVRGYGSSMRPHST